MTSGNSVEARKWYESNFTEETFIGSAGVPVRYAYSPMEKSKVTLVAALGRTEFIEKYCEFCWDLRDNDIAICLIEHCGQGKSGRLLEDRQKGHIEDFDNYLADLYTLLKTVVAPVSSGPVVLMGYSMGGPVAILLSAAYGDLLDGLLLASPMLQINTGWFLPPFLAEIIGRIACSFGKSEDYVWGGGPFDSAMEYEGNVLTSSKTRFRYNLDLMAHETGVALGSPTFGWMVQAYMAMREAREAGGKISCPVLVLMGEQDTLVSRGEIKKFCRTVNECVFKSYRDSRHEIFMEQDWIRDQVFSDIRGFVNQISRRSVR